MGSLIARDGVSAYLGAVYLRGLYKISANQIARLCCPASVTFDIQLSTSKEQRRRVNPRPFPGVPGGGKETPLGFLGGLQRSKHDGPPSASAGRHDRHLDVAFRSGEREFRVVVCLSFVVSSVFYDDYGRIKIVFDFDLYHTAVTCKIMYGIAMMVQHLAHRVALATKCM